MKFNYKKISIIGLIGIFFISALLCCCLTDVVVADEPTSSCHQKTQDAESKNADECECDQSIAMLNESIQLKDPLLETATVSLVKLLSIHYSSSSDVKAYQAPPQYYDTLPIYIKHDVFRI